MSAIPWENVEDAIFDWISEGSGLGDVGVIWSHENGPRPDAPYVSLLISNLRQIGHDWVDVYDSESPEPGEEITLKARGPRYCTLSIQCFAAIGEMIGPMGAVAILNDIISSLKFHRHALSRAGVGVAGFGPVAAIGNAMLGTQLEPRAVVEMQFHLASEVTGFETFIERVIAHFENTDTTFEVAIADDGWSNGFSIGFGNDG